MQYILVFPNHDRKLMKQSFEIILKNENVQLGANTSEDFFSFRRGYVTQRLKRDQRDWMLKHTRKDYKVWICSTDVKYSKSMQRRDDSTLRLFMPIAICQHAFLN